MHFPWQSFTVLIHFRGWQFDREIDSGFFDVYFVPSGDADGSAYAPMDDSKDVIRHLTALEPDLRAAFRRVCELVLADPVRDIRMHGVVWEKEAVPVWGGDAYWFKYVILD